MPQPEPSDPLSDRPEYLKARAEIAGDLYREGKITREECFRLEMDASLGVNSGPVRFEPNDEYRRWRKEHPIPKED